ncbi:MAG: putative Ig domain-containing protein [Chloroflexi bacterium]|nr:putative Ig domain-containing protein [Chloroflexota bacterium]
MTGYCSHKLNLKLMCVAVIALTPVPLILSGFYPANADLSSTTERYYGSVYNNDALVPCGYVITAMVGATKVGETTTDSQGRYGYSPVFEISASPGQIVNFFINDHPTIQKAVFQGGVSTKLNLSAYGAASQMPSTSCSACSSSYGTACSTSACGITPTTLPSATVGTPYSTDLNAHGGITPYTWSITSGSLPAGLTLDSTLGVIKGVPTSPKLYSFTIQVNDSASNYLTLATCILVSAAVSSSQSTGIQTTTQTAAVTSNFLGTEEALDVSGNTLIAAKELINGDKRVSLSLAAGTVMQLQGRSLIGAGNESNPPAAADGSVCVRSYSFTPAGATFSPAATMTLTYVTPLPPGLAESGLYIAYWNGSDWIKLASTVNTAAKEVSASVSHFTIFAIRGVPESAAQASASSTSSNTAASSGSSPVTTSSSAATADSAQAFAFSDLSVTPATVSPDQKVTISVRVINSGASETTGDVVLKIDGKNETQKSVTLAAGKSQTVEFTISKSTSGKYMVGIGGLSEILKVDGDAGSEQTQRIPSEVIVGLVCLGGLLIAIVLLRDIFRHRS